MYEDSSIKDYIDGNFKKKYALKTRELNKNEIHPSVLSSGKNKLTVFDIDYNLILKRLEELVFERIIIDKVKKIDIEKNILYLVSSQEKKYDFLINTLPVNMFQKLSKININNHDFTAFNTTFFKCEYNNYLKNIKNSLQLEYFYSIASTQWHRCNLFEDYVVFEVKGKTDILMDEYKVLDKITLPFAQIKFSYDNINKTGNNIIHIGRYAQWSHKIKMEQIIERFEK